MTNTNATYTSPIRMLWASIAAGVAIAITLVVTMLATPTQAQAKTYYDPPAKCRIYFISARKWYQSSTFKLKQKPGTAIYRYTNGRLANVPVYGSYKVVMRRHKSSNDLKGTIVYQGYWSSGTFTYKLQKGTIYSCNLIYCGVNKLDVLIGPKFFQRVAAEPLVAQVR